MSTESTPKHKPTLEFICTLCVEWVTPTTLLHFATLPIHNSEVTFITPQHLHPVILTLIFKFLGKVDPFGNVGLPQDEFLSRVTPPLTQAVDAVTYRLHRHITKQIWVVLLDFPGCGSFYIPKYASKYSWPDQKSSKASQTLVLKLADRPLPLIKSGNSPAHCPLTGTNLLKYMLGLQATFL